MSAQREPLDPLADALRVVFSRRGAAKYQVQGDELAWARQVRDVAQVCWMQAGEPERLRSEDEDRSKVCRDLVRKRSRGARLLRLVPTGPAPVRPVSEKTPRRRKVETPES